MNEFLGNNAPTPAPTMDWAEESQNFDGNTKLCISHELYFDGLNRCLSLDYSSYQAAYSKPVNLSSLPTAPRSSRTAEIDTSALPDGPPFTAFVGNLPYECDEQTIADFFKDMKVNMFFISTCSDAQPTHIYNAGTAFL